MELQNHRNVRVLYSFPHRLGTTRICYTAWQQVDGLANAGAALRVLAGSIEREIPKVAKGQQTLAWGKIKLPYRLLGSMRTIAAHDAVVGRWLTAHQDEVDIVHVWPLGGRKTLRTAQMLGIPTVMERPNAHTRFAYEVVQRECDRLGVQLPPNHEHAYKEDVLRIEEEEYDMATKLLCPSDFVAKSFLDKGFKPEQIARHFYGVDERRFYPLAKPDLEGPFTMIFVGVCAVRKGLHFALEAWLKSPASRDGKFLIAGTFVPAYEEKLSEMLSHPSIQVLGHRKDVPELVRNSHALCLPTIEEGSPLVCTEAMASGCVPIASDVCTGICKHGLNALIHPVGNVALLTEHIARLHADRKLLADLRESGLKMVPEITWKAAGVRLLEEYQKTIDEFSKTQKDRLAI